MKTLFPVFIFFLSNAVGFSVGPALYALALTQKIINIDSQSFDITHMQNDMAVILMVWLVCAIFSFASFFLSKKWKIIFLSVPIIMPLITSIILLKSYI